MRRTRPWDGTDYIERRVNLAQNRLSYVIVPSHSPLDAQMSRQYLDDARRLRIEIARMKAPTKKAKTYQAHVLARLGSSIKRAKNMLYTRTKRSR